MHPRRLIPLVMLVSVAFAAGCTIRAVREAPVVDKSRPATAVAAPSAAAPLAPPVAREATNGTYVVRQGDTLYSIAVAFGQDWRDLARWNGIDDPARVRVGQELRVAPPAGETQGAVAAVVPVAPSGSVEARPLETTPLPAPPVTAPAAPPQLPPSQPGTPVPTPTPAPPTPPAPTVPAEPPRAVVVPEGAVQWQWPTLGKVVEPFSETRNKGIDIGGVEGDPVVAAGDGEVVYSGNGLRGYGNLIIIKHSDDFISAYGHNRSILVKQGQGVKRGQRIAELGRSDATQAKLHFEIRQRGKPVDPLKFLPPR